MTGSATLDGELAAPAGFAPQRRQRGSAIAAAGMAVPDHVVSNEPIAERLGVDDHWIRKRTGVVERRIAEPGTTCAGLAAEAAMYALRSAGCEPESVDLVLVATMTPDDITPNVAPVVVSLAGLGTAGSADVGAACTGWLAGVRLAAAQVETGRADRVLVIGADILSRVTDRDDRATAALFADGAGAVLVTPSDGAGRIGPVMLGTDPAGLPLIYAHHDEGVIRMRGGATFGAAVDHMAAATRSAVAAAGLDLGDVDLFAYHQANGRIIRAVGERLGLPEERVLFYVDRFGNTSAATIPIALAAAAADGLLTPGAKVLMGAFGAGFTWGAAVVEWGTGGSAHAG
jgi:3-oxoacyl-[acyl-carrier-protein] synthase III